MAYACPDLNLFIGASMTFFAYTCQVQILPVYSELVNPNAKRMKKVINRSIAVDIFFYVLISYAGYFATLNKTSNIMLEREPIEGHSVDYAMVISTIAIIVVLINCIPVNYLPFRQQIFYIFFKKEDCSKMENIVCTAIFILSTAIVAIVYPEITKVLTILGGLCSVTIAYLVPMFAFVKLSGRPLRSPSVIGAIVFFGILICSGYFSVLLTLYEMIAPKDYFGDGSCQSFPPQS